MHPHERNVLITTSLGHFLSHFNMLVFPAGLLPLTAELQMPLAEVLGLSFWMYLLFRVTALPWGLAADRLGARPLMALYYAGAGSCGLAAAGWIGAPDRLALALAGLGLFSGIYHPAGLGLISKQVSRLSYAMGINGMFGNSGLAAAPPAAGAVIWFWGPQAAYLVLGAANLAGLIVMALLPLPAALRAEPRVADANGGRGFGVLLVAMMLGGVSSIGAAP